MCYGNVSDTQRPANKRRKRKASTSGPANSAPPAPNKKRSPGPNFSLASQVSFAFILMNFFIVRCSVFSQNGAEEKLNLH